MSIFESVQIQDLHRTVEDRIRPAVLTQDVRETGYEDLLGFATRKEYKLVIAVEQNFWANRAQFDHARSHALKAAASFLYSDVLRHLDHLANAIVSGDREEALDTLARIRREMTS